MTLARVDNVTPRTINSVLGKESLNSPVVLEGTGASIEPRVGQNELVESTKIIDLAPPVLDSGKSTALISSVTLQELISSEISMPRGWNKQIVMYENMTLVVYSVTKCIKIGGKLTTYGLKELILKGDMSFQINILGKPVDEKHVEMDLSAIQSTQKLEELLLWLSRSDVCTGTKLSDEQNRGTNAVFKDPSGTWRTIGCSLLSTASVCPSCRTARKSALSKFRRLQKRGVGAKRIRLTVPSHDRRLLDKLHKNRQNLQKAAVRAKRKIGSLHSTIAECQKKMSTSGESLDFYFQSANLTESQKHLLQEIVTAAKCKGSRGRRYSEEWILLCMLLHMRSPTGYIFLRKNGILPLPHVRTVRRYLSKLDTTCGFDPRFFEVFKLSLAKKDEMQRHGILLIDEIATRESANVNSKTLSYEGLIDFGADGEKASDLNQKANHGLVIMFNPLADNYAQPIVV